MKSIICLILLSITILSYSQNQGVSDPYFKEYRSYQKKLYIDFMPKEKIPAELNNYFYTKLGPINYASQIEEESDSIHKTQKLFLITKMAGSGFLSINKGALDKMDESVSFKYVCNDDTVKTFKQMSDLITLKNEDIKQVHYKRILSTQRLIIDIQIKK